MQQPDFELSYDHIRSGGTGYYEQKRGLIAVHGKEAVQFLDGLISNDVKTLEEGGQMLAAFPNAQGRLLAVVRVQNQGDKFLFETEEATRQKVFDNLFRFTLAGDFFVEDISDNYRFFSVFGSDFLPSIQPLIELESPAGTDYFIDTGDTEDFLTELQNIDAAEVTDDLYEVLRIESGIPLYGVDMDETTIVPELGNDGLISYNKGCYIGQEIIARIHFRGHVAKKLTGLVFETGGKSGQKDLSVLTGDSKSSPESESLSSLPARGGLAAASADGVVGAAGGFLNATELKTTDGKNAGRITSVAFSPKLGQIIALAFVRYDYLAEGTELTLGKSAVTVRNLPFIG